MRIRVRLWLLLVVGALLLVGATLASGAEQDASVVCEPESAGGNALPAAAWIAETNLALLPAAGEGCLNCHADQERVKELAVEEEVDESHSEGPG